MHLLAGLLALAPAASPDAYLEASRAAPEGSPRQQSCLAAWASIAKSNEDPELKPWVERAGRGARLSGRIEGRVLVARWQDPLGAIGRVDAHVLGDDGRQRLTALAPGRFALPELKAGDQIEVSAYSASCLPHQALLSALVAPEQALAPPVFEPRADAAVVEPSEDSGFGILWGLAIGLAAAGAGVALYEELR